MQTKSEIKRAAAQEALNKADGASKLASMLTRRLGEDVPVERVKKWRRNGVPPYMVLHVEALTGVPRTRLDPDLYPFDEYEAARALINKLHAA